MPEEIGLVAIREIIGGGAFLALLIFTIYDKAFSKRAKDHQIADDKLTKIFQDTINRLEGNQAEMQTQMNKMEKELSEIKKENEIMVRIFQGRDEGFLEYQKRGRRLMDKVEEEVMPLLREIHSKMK